MMARVVTERVAQLARKLWAAQRQEETIDASRRLKGVAHLNLHLLGSPLEVASNLGHPVASIWLPESHQEN